MNEILLNIIVGILIFDYLLERLLDYLNSTTWSNILPPELNGIYDPERYRLSQEYEKTRHNFSLLTTSVSFLSLMLMFFFNGFAYVDSIARSITDNTILMALVFFGILGLASEIISIPFSIYSTFVIEEKFGFNRTTPLTFISDKIKGFILSAIIGGGLLSLIVFIYENTGRYFWILAWASISIFIIFLTMFYSSIIVPLFNKQTPLEHGELRDAIENFARSSDFKLDNIYVIDGSKRSSKANAYFSGLGSKKRIVLYDTLIKDHTVEELVSVLAHEIGHYKMKHTLIGVIISILQIGLTLFILSWFIGNPELSKALGGSQHSFHMGILAFSLLYSPLSFLIGIIMNIMSRKNEYQADRYAAEKYHAKPLQDALKKLSVKNLSNLKPHPVYVFFYYSHPPLLERLRHLDSFN